MAAVIITLKVMPESPDINLEELYSKIKPLITDFTGEEEFKKEEEPVAFGLKALKIIFVMDEAKGGIDDMEAKIAELEGVNSVDVIDVRRAIG